MDSSDYYIPAAALWLCLAVKLPALLKAWRDPLVRTVCLVIALGGAGFLFAAPPTIAAVNRISGVPNASSLLVYVIISAFSASCLLLIVHWRGGPPEYVQRVSRRWRIGYMLVITALVALFLLGDAPVERRTDFDTYYASAPFIGEMILLYLLAHMTAALVTTVLCWRWALQVHGWLRAGLWTLCLGWLLNLSFSSLKLAAVAAHWSGQDWDMLSTTLSPLFSALAAPCATIGFLLPLIGPRTAAAGRALAAYRRLGPLWSELSSASPRSSLAAPIPWYASPHVHLTRREAGIQDGLSLVRPHLDDAIRACARSTAEAAGSSRAEADLVGLAAMVSAAAQATRLDRAETPLVPGDLAVAAVRASLVGVSRTLRTSPVVAAVRSDAARPSPLSVKDGERSPT
ncbi:MAB_1171c family putative transporter [Streptomyces sp. 142MFCol3.1]|uniref:MAB_1171c family putative transporter n=1 Tax=Streptomyces sp. 142MFCol3.1 TaxID=1172179 RepID=UPI0004034EC4|nr:MAB_1171c family putative transporter [Streptomyces sp. 142MFCol3.1]